MQLNVDECKMVIKGSKWKEGHVGRVTATEGRQGLLRKSLGVIHLTLDGME